MVIPLTPTRAAVALKLGEVIYFDHGQRTAWLSGSGRVVIDCTNDECFTCGAFMGLLCFLRNFPPDAELRLTLRAGAA